MRLRGRKHIFVCGCPQWDGEVEELTIWPCGLRGGRIATVIHRGLGSDSLKSELWLCQSCAENIIPQSPSVLVYKMRALRPTLSSPWED